MSDEIRSARKSTSVDAVLIFGQLVSSDSSNKEGRANSARPNPVTNTTYLHGYHAPGVPGVPEIEVPAVPGLFPIGGVPEMIVGRVPGVPGV